MSFGTAQLESEVRRRWGDVPITRWDRDTSRSAGSHEALLREFAEGRSQVLVGTQGYGFYQFTAQDEDLDDVRRGPRSTSQLYRAHVTVFARHGNLVFAGTAVDGLSSIDVGTAARDTGTWDWE